MSLPNDFEVAETGTHKTLSAQQLKIEAVKEHLRMIIDAYAESTFAHAAAQKALDELNQGED